MTYRMESLPIHRRGCNGTILPGRLVKKFGFASVYANAYLLDMSSISVKPERRAAIFPEVS